ncbi:hypothetical protein [Paracoccus sp. JM45]|uniref:hypothetical protein n=1 Tax=Paracoccus sp. JM45 TaxID=2283626 RepID=UPI000E6C7631|nr:hypothetical protein [Paracoccus sp. JM45]RJE81616.1 hypothetical protein DWB67_03035 [Paracoccus sp. JM45]
MRLIPLIILALAGCASPSLDFRGAIRHDVVVDSLRFAVFQREDEAQIIRLDNVRRSARADLPMQMVRAAEQATGCAVSPASMTTQAHAASAVARVDLDCRA